MAKELNFNDKDVENIKSQISDRYSEEEKKMIELNKVASDLYKYNLTLQATTNVHLNKYLKKRNISKKIAQQFNLGWSSDKKMITKYFEKRKINLDEGYDSGLLNKNENEFNDFFFNRLIFPIANGYGDIVGFSGRTILDSKTSKYINTRETIIFKKQNILYNLHNVKKERNISNIIIVEGFMDVIAFHHAKITNCVATMGLNISDSHINQLKTITNNITLCLDFDASGLNYSLKISKKLLINGFTLNIIDINDYKDMDSFLQSNSINDVNNKYKEKKDYIDFMMNYLLKNVNKDDYTSTNSYLNTIIGLISCCDDFKKEFYINKLGKLTKFSKEILAKKIKTTDKSSRQIHEHIEHNRPELSKDMINELKIIAYIMTNSDCNLNDINHWFVPKFMESKLILEAVITIIGNKQIPSIGTISAFFNDKNSNISTIIFNQLDEYCGVEDNNLNLYPEYLIKLKNIYENNLIKMHRNNIINVFNKSSENDKFILNIEVKKFK